VAVRAAWAQQLLAVAAILALVGAVAAAEPGLQTPQRALAGLLAKSGLRARQVEVLRAALILQPQGALVVLVETGGQAVPGALTVALSILPLGALAALAAAL